MQPLDDKKQKKQDKKVKFLILQPAGFPMISGEEEYPIVKNKKVFERYMREQWIGLKIKKGDYLFDGRMYPGFAFEVVIAEPENSMIDEETTILLEDDTLEEEKEVGIQRREYDIQFKDVIGQDLAKKKCKLIKKFLDEPEKFRGWEPRNVLFYGPAGTGKTMMAKALVSETNVNLIGINATNLIGEHVGEGSANIHRLYDYAEKDAPCIIFIDEIDAIALDRRYQELRGDVSEIVNALITEMDGITDRRGVCLIAATNMADILDSAIKSRFEEEIEFKLPDRKERLEILEVYAKKYPISLSKDVDLEKIADSTEGFSGRDLTDKILKVALHRAILDDEKEVKTEYLNCALDELGEKKRKNVPDTLYR